MSNKLLDELAARLHAEFDAKLEERTEQLRKELLAEIALCPHVEMTKIRARMEAHGRREAQRLAAEKPAPQPPRSHFAVTLVGPASDVELFGQRNRHGQLMGAVQMQLTRGGVAMLLDREIAALTSTDPRFAAMLADGRILTRTCTDAENIEAERSRSVSATYNATPFDHSGPQA